MKMIYLDREGEDAFCVSWHTINGRQSRKLDSRDAAESYAVSKMGKTGCVISTLDMTSKQLAELELKAREARTIAARPDNTGLSDHERLCSGGAN